MKDLIEALQILYKYGNPDYPTNCEHDELVVLINPELVSDEDTQRLDHLGFTAGDESFYSFRFGAA